MELKVRLKQLTLRELWLVEQLAAAWECSETEVRKHLDRDTLP